MIVGNINTNTNSLQAKGVTTGPLIASLASNNYRGSRFVENPNVFRNSATVVRADTNLRKLSSSTNSTRKPTLGVRTTANSTSSAPTFAIGRKFKVTANPIPESPVKSTQKMNYFCEWNFCRRSFDDKLELKKHLKEDHLNSGENSIRKDKISYDDDLAEVKIEV